MHRTTIMLPEDLKAMATRRAHEDGISMGELIRLALQEYLLRDAEPVTDDPFFADTTTYDGPVPPDISINHDKYLYDDLEEEIRGYDHSEDSSNGEEP